ncbi:MAG: tRNA (adenosine(37)-N6)-threonylcarbamoyltransferase complex ATPase subunit type 1 TsaE [Bacteroidota bacterium]
MNTQTYIVETPARLDEAAAQIISLAKQFPIIALYGSLGAGKTTLVQTICKLMELETEATSPTFTIVQTYRKNQEDAVYHFDLYRIENTDQLFAIGYEEYFDSGCPCFIEWPENAGSLLPYPHLHVDVEEQDNSFRKISISLIQTP